MNDLQFVCDVELADFGEVRFSFHVNYSTHSYHYECRYPLAMFTAHSFLDAFLVGIKAELLRNLQNLGGPTLPQDTSA